MNVLIPEAPTLHNKEPLPEAVRIPYKGPSIQLILVRLVFLVTLGSGLFNLYSVAARHFPQRLEILQNIFPLEFIHFSRFIVLLIGLALVISSINIYKRKRRAYQSVLALSVLSIVFHMTRGLHYEESILSLFLIVILLASSKYFNVKSSMQSLPFALVRVGIAVTSALLYGSMGFWFIEHHHFQYNFNWKDALAESIRYLVFVGDPELVAYTQHAAWFLNSLYVMSAATIVYAIFALYRPMIYRFRIHPREVALAKEIVESGGHSALDFFKYWPDKSFFFSPSNKSVIAYRVGNNFAVALGDPSGPPEEVEEITRDFMNFCSRNDWGFAFHQAMPDFLPVYESLGLRKLKVGDDAIVDLVGFTLEGKTRKSLRQAVNRIEESGVRFEFHDPPISDEIISQVEEISNKWLDIPGHRERQFTLGSFDREYLRSTALVIARGSDGKAQAFINLIPSYYPSESTIDLMRRLPESPNGIMDFLFIKLFLRMQQQGFKRFNMGMAPMSGFQEGENATVEEKAIHYFFQHLNFLFRFRGLRSFKAKYASFWEPRYAVYKSPLDLPRMALALREISEI